MHRQPGSPTSLLVSFYGGKLQVGESVADR